MKLGPLSRSAAPADSERYEAGIGQQEAVDLCQRREIIDDDDAPIVAAAGDNTAVAATLPTLPIQSPIRSKRFTAAVKSTGDPQVSPTPLSRRDVLVAAGSGISECSAVKGFSDGVVLDIDDLDSLFVL
jgi:hypothetical protein